MSLLICTCGGTTFAVPVGVVRETMRPLGVLPFPGMPAYVLGVARIRGLAVPVVDAGLLMQAGAGTATRWITVAAGPDRQVAVAVGSVTGIRTMPEAELRDLPPLLAGEGSGPFGALAALDHELLLSLQVSRLLPDDAWERLTPGTSPAAPGPLDGTAGAASDPSPITGG